MAVVDEGRRHKLYQALERQLGDDNAETMMSLLPPVNWGDVATKHDLNALEQRLTLRIDGIEQRFDGLDQRISYRIDGIEQRFDGTEQRFDGIEQRFGRIEQRFDGIEQRFGGIGHRFDRLEDRFDDLEATFRNHTKTYVTWMLATQSVTITIVLAAISLLR